jgi:hypothetical protein
MQMKIKKNVMLLCFLSIFISCISQNKPESVMAILNIPAADLPPECSFQSEMKEGTISIGPNPQIITDPQRFRGGVTAFMTKFFVEHPNGLTEASQFGDALKRKQEELIPQILATYSAIYQDEEKSKLGVWALLLKTSQPRRQRRHPPQFNH